MHSRNITGLLGIFIAFDDQRHTRELSNLFDELDDIFILKQVIFANFLGMVLDRRAPNQRVLELLDNALVNAIAEVRDLHAKIKGRGEKQPNQQLLCSLA